MKIRRQKPTEIVVNNRFALMEAARRVIGSLGVWTGRRFCFYNRFSF